MKAALRCGAAVLGLVALALSGAAQAGGYGLTANVITEVTNFPAADRKDGNLWFDREPQAGQLQAVDRTAQLGPGVAAVGRFLGSTGLLKAYAGASYPFGGSGLATSTVSSSFYDTVMVTGAGLAVGTPVSYRVDFSIEGTVLGAAPDPTFGAIAEASVTLQDDYTYQSVKLNWGNRTQSPGVYSLVLDTKVGSAVVIYGSLAVGARVQGNSVTARSAAADFYNSAHYYITPSVAGLNTVGLSGHDFTAAPVPEPSTWALMALGLGWVAVRQRRASRRG
ncbi:PEP-CTERM sorting domain-containing protein [Pelomonas cellulosilytica]|uniref:PEP-CTERM sorting domain-containing protein n=1 Tax=Pelomonas cellulosilytica TaxID=2906762 RepID=A0ABS8XY69_9BURK|nr:PEP-CTERM sorting domain-containing protein [Pelomonas sp. P8]MCE4555721.1 PEP-CTERM sorting domain-containing protein [Pelomonas sp. P8]